MDNISNMIESFVNGIVHKKNDIIVKHISKTNSVVNKLYCEMNKTRNVVNSTSTGLVSTISNTNKNFNILLRELKNTRKELEVLKNEVKVLKNTEESNYRASVALKDSSMYLVSNNLHGKRSRQYVEDEYVEDKYADKKIRI